jgi:phosphoserine aminotransferase
MLDLPDRSAEGEALLEEVRTRIRRLLGVPDTFSVLLVPGGGTHQFVSLAYSLKAQFSTLAFVETDYWTQRAREEASNFMPVDTLCSTRDTGYRALPRAPEIRCAASEAAVFFTSNNTAAGTQWRGFPTVGGGCTVIDMSSDLFCSHPDFERVDIVMACAQKQFGAAGISVLLVRNTVLEHMQSVGGYLSLSRWHATSSVYSTFPMVLAVIADECLRFIESEGSDVIRHRCERCAELLYAFLDSSVVFRPRVTNHEFRSIHNVTFELRNADESMRTRIVLSAQTRGLVGLRGHPSVGGFRASFYVGATESNAASLIDFLTEMESEVLYGHA